MCCVMPVSYRPRVVRSGEKLVHWLGALWHQNMLTHVPSVDWNANIGIYFLSRTIHKVFEPLEVNDKDWRNLPKIDLLRRVALYFAPGTAPATVPAKLLHFAKFLKAFIQRWIFYIIWKRERKVHEGIKLDARVTARAAFKL